MTKLRAVEASDDWSCLTADASTFDWINKEDVQEQSVNDVSDTWELTSEIGSVLSLGDESVAFYRQSSYADAAKNFDVPISRIQKKAVTNRRPVDLQIPENEPLVDDDSKFDAFFVMEGYKGLRGGKAARRFKGNQKSPSRQKPRSAKQS